MVLTERQPRAVAMPEPQRGTPSTAAVLGHPLHPMVVPFPIAFLTSALGSDIAYRRTGDPFWARASRTLLRTGLAIGAGAAVLGATDFFTIPHARRHTVGPFHALGNATALGLAAYNLSRRRDGGVPPEGLALSAATAALLAATAWAGGELTYRHRIGVIGHRHDG